MTGYRTQNLEEKFEDLRSDMFVQTTNVGKLAHIQLKDRERDLQLGAERDSLIRYGGRTNVGKLAHIQLKDRERDLQLGAERDSLIRYRG